MDRPTNENLIKWIKEEFDIKNINKEDLSYNFDINYNDKPISIDFMEYPPNDSFRFIVHYKANKSIHDITGDIPTESTRENIFKYIYNLLNIASELSN